MPPKFKPGDIVLHKSPSHAWCKHPPGAKCSGSLHAVAAVLPFTLHDDQVVNVRTDGLGRCRVVSVNGTNVNVVQLSSGREAWMDISKDVDQPDGTPVSSYELKADDGNTFWASENTLTLAEAADPNVFLSTTWHRNGAKGYRGSTRQSATKAWTHF